MRIFLLALHASDSSLTNRHRLLVLLMITILVLCSCGANIQKAAVDDPETFERFETIIERLRQDLKVPGMAAVILKNQEVVWARGFGYANLEARLEATPETPFHLASVTKPIAGTIILQLVEEGLLDLNTPISDYGLELDAEGTEPIRLIHLFTHTSQGQPGTVFRYHGDRYGMMGAAVKQVAGKSFRSLALEKIFKPLGMTNTAASMLDPEVMDRFIAYMNANGIYEPIRLADGHELELCEGFEYTNADYRPTLFAAAVLTRNAMSAAGMESGNYFIYEDVEIDSTTQHKYNRFWADDNEFQDIYRVMVRPYRLDDSLRVVRGQYSMFFNCAAGLISSPLDLARFDIALDKGELIKRETREWAFTPVRTPSGEELTYGLGWFTQEYKGVRLIWHGGEWDCISALYLKVPAENLTFIICANARAMSQAFMMGRGDVLCSGPGMAFLRLFVYEDRFGEKGPDVDWKSDPEQIVPEIQAITSDDLRELYKKELENMWIMYFIMQETEASNRIPNQIYAVLATHPEISDYRDLTILAEIDHVGNDEHRTTDLMLDRDATVRVYAIGEMTSDGAYDFGWIENTRGDTVWMMADSIAVDAGGSFKNRKVDEVIHLGAGGYVVHYKADDSHAFGGWNALPPDHLFWGIRVYRAD
jgi:CubicO group peptidase (beta-lactamase class C family)